MFSLKIVNDLFHHSFQPVKFVQKSVIWEVSNSVLLHLYVTLENVHTLPGPPNVRFCLHLIQRSYQDCLPKLAAISELWQRSNG